MVSALIGMCADALAQSAGIIHMSGRVEGNGGEPLVGVMSGIPDTEVAALSNMAGVFSLRIPARYAGYKVVFSLTGYNNDTLDVIDSNDILVVLSHKEIQHVSEVLVSTQKRLQRELDVPIALSVIDAERQRDLDLDQIDEMARYVPGFQNPLQDNSVSAAAIRGVTSDGGESYSQQRISVFMDDISIGRLQCLVIEPFDLERVEVVKGPQCTLFGRGAEIGAISYVHRKPVQYLDFYARAGYGNYNKRTGEAMLNLPLGSRVANRTAFRYDAHDGYIENLGGGRLNGKEAVSARNSTSFFFNGKNTLNISFDYIHNNDPGTSFKTNRVGLPDDPADTSPFTKAYLNGGDILGIDRNVVSGIAQFDSQLNERMSLSNTLGVRYYDCLDYYDVDGCYLDMLIGRSSTSGLQLSEELRFSWNNGRNLEGFFGLSYFMEDVSHEYYFSGNLQYVFPAAVGPNIREQVRTLPESVAGGVGLGLEGLAAQLKASHPEPEVGAQIEGVILNYKDLAEDAVRNNLNKLYDNLYLEQHYWESTPDIISLSAETVYTVLENYINQLMESNPQMESLLAGIMGDAGVDGFVRSFGIEDMLRQEPALVAISNAPLPDEHHENQKEHCRATEGSIFADFSWNFLPKLYLTLGLRGTAEFMETSYESSSLQAPILGTSLLYHSSHGEVMKVDTSYTTWVGRASVNWKFDNTHNLYASVSKGRRPAQVYFDLRPDVVRRLSPELLWNYELGIKGISKYGNFKYYAAFFYYNWKNFQSYVFGSDEHGGMRSYNDDRGKAHAFGLDGSLLYTFGEHVSSFIDYSYLNARYTERDMNGNLQALHGKRFRMIPDHTFDCGFNFKFRLGRKGYIFSHPSLAVSGKLYFDGNNTDMFLQKAYSLVNMNIGYAWCGKRDLLDYDLRIYGKNLTDTDYLVDAGNSGDVIGYPTFVAGAPRTFGMMLRVAMHHREKSVAAD